MYRNLERIDEELSSDLVNTGSTRWMVPYADMLTLLVGFFLVLFSVIQMDNNSLEDFGQKMKQSLSEKTQELQEAREEVATVSETLSEAQDVIAEAQQAAEPMPEPAEESPVMMLAAELNDKLGVQLQNQMGEDAAIHVSQEERGVVISLRDGVLFTPGQAELTRAAQEKLDGIAEILARQSRPIRVEGHTDNAPIRTARFPTNWELSTARATNIVKYLVTRHGFDPKSLSAAGYGEFRPVADNSTIEGKQKNRRVDIVVLNDKNSLEEPNVLPLPSEIRHNAVRPLPEGSDSPDPESGPVTQGNQGNT